jgi:hypothetical protein
MEMSICFALPQNYGLQALMAGKHRVRGGAGLRRCPLPCIPLASMTLYVPSSSLMLMLYLEYSAAAMA